jgi:hypothetical protein
MAKRTFTNEQLAVQWRAAKAKNGTRRDVVLGLMGQLGIEDNADNYRRVYNNVNQRVKQLEEGTPAITFPELNAGKKGARRSGSEVANLNAILNGETVTVEATTETATAVADAAVTV